MHCPRVVTTILMLFLPEPGLAQGWIECAVLEHDRADIARVDRCGEPPISTLMPSGEHFPGPT
jgi:hypothetical protein